jgi:hypothetical protein
MSSDEPKNTFWGCIYDSPVGRGAIPGPRDLTIDEIKSMNLIGLPIRVEHQEGDVGRVIDCRIDPLTGKTEVCFELSTSPSGIAARSMIQNESIRQLSLKHLVYPNRVMVPEEVSLCIKGARPQTDVYKTKNYKGSGLTTSIEAQPYEVVCMSASLPENFIYSTTPQYNKPPEMQQQTTMQNMQQMMAPMINAIPQAPTHHAQVQERDAYGRFAYMDQDALLKQQQQLMQDQIALQQALAAQGAPSPVASTPVVPSPVAPVAAPVQTPVEKAVPQESKKRSFEEIVMETAKSLKIENNPEAQKIFMDFAVQNAKSEFELMNANKQLMEENEKLKKQRTEDMKQTETIAEQVAATIEKIYKQFVPTMNVNQDVMNKGKLAMQASPEITNMLAPMVVACSNIVELASNKQQNALVKEIDNLQRDLSFYSKSFEHMQSPVPTPIAHQQAPPPVWQQPVAMPPPMPSYVAPVPVAASAVEVTAPLDDINSVVARMKASAGGYNATTHVNNVMRKEDLPKGFFHSK